MKIDLNEALLGTSFSVYTLDGKAMDVKIDDIISPDYVKVLPGEDARELAWAARRHEAQI